jgi:hypothetical protein
VDKAAARLASVYKRSSHKEQPPETKQMKTPAVVRSSTNSYGTLHVSSHKCHWRIDTACTYMAPCAHRRPSSMDNHEACGHTDSCVSPYYTRTCCPYPRSPPWLFRLGHDGRRRMLHLRGSTCLGGWCSETIWCFSVLRVCGRLELSI